MQILMEKNKIKKKKVKTHSGTKPSKIREEPASSCDASLPKCLLLASPCAFALHLPRLVRTETQALLPSLVLTVPLRCPQEHCSDHLNSAGPVPAPGFPLGLGWHFTDINPTLLYLSPESFMQYSSNIIVIVFIIINNNNKNNNNNSNN